MKGSNIQTNSSHVPLIGATIGFMLALVIGLIAYLSMSSGSSITSSTSAKPAKAASNPYAILKPATVPPKVGECSQSLTYASNGDPSPISCANGEINIQDWQAMSALEPTVMRLGYGASESQIKSAICTDGNVADQDSSAAISAPLESNAYEIASLYYGWNYSIDPVSLLKSGC